MKYFISFYFFCLNEGVEHVTRGCALDEHDAQTKCNDFKNAAKTAGFSASAKCLTCNTDGCNGAAKYGPHLIANVIWMALPIAIAKILLI